MEFYYQSLLCVLCYLVCYETEDLEHLYRKLSGLLDIKSFLDFISKTCIIRLDCVTFVSHVSYIWFARPCLGLCVTFPNCLIFFCLLHPLVSADWRFEICSHFFSWNHLKMLVSTIFISKISLVLKIIAGLLSFVII